MIIFIEIMLKLNYNIQMQCIIVAKTKFNKNEILLYKHTVLCIMKFNNNKYLEDQVSLANFFTIILCLLEDAI